MKTIRWLKQRIEHLPDDMPILMHNEKHEVLPVGALMVDQFEKRAYLLLDQNFPEVYEYAAEGKKILAIKAYREQTYCSLREAKDFVDNLMAGMKADHRMLDLHSTP
jgi:ribosomal protein L7/L12